MPNLSRFVEDVEREALEAQARLEARRREALARIRREEAEADALLGRLRRDYGYEVDLARCLVSGRYEAFAYAEGRTVGYGWGASRLEALRSLAGDLGLEVRK